MYKYIHKMLPQFSNKLYPTAKAHIERLGYFIESINNNPELAEAVRSDYIHNIAKCHWNVTKVVFFEYF